MVTALIFSVAILLKVSYEAPEWLGELFICQKAVVPDHDAAFKDMPTGLSISHSERANSMPLAPIIAYLEKQENSPPAPLFI